MKPLPDPYPVEPLTKPPNCTITVPGSKSITNRALILAALADGKCTLRGALWADDTQVMVDSLQKLGFDVTVEPDPAEECNRTITVVGHGGEIPAKKAELYVGNAGTATRFLTALVCLGHGEYTIRGDDRMHERPMGELFRALGIEGDRLPVTIRASGMKPSKLRVTGKESSQFASALLLIGHEVETEPHAYVELTRRMMKEFQPDFAIEPDLSGASYFVAAGWLTGGRVAVNGWSRNSLQIDGDFPNFLPPPATLSRACDLGDSVMTLAICALFGKQPMRLIDATRMRLQETDRIKAMVTELRRVGAKAEEHEDGFTVWPVEERPQAGRSRHQPQAGTLAPPSKLHGADIETYNDHRMAMCFAVLGLKVPGIRIKNPGCVSKTFPNFFEKLEQLRS